MIKIFLVDIYKILLADTYKILLTFTKSYWLTLIKSSVNLWRLLVVGPRPALPASSWQRAPQSYNPTPTDQQITELSRSSMTPSDKLNFNQFHVSGQLFHTSQEPVEHPNKRNLPLKTCLSTKERGVLLGRGPLFS